MPASSPKTLIEDLVVRYEQDKATTTLGSQPSVREARFWQTDPISFSLEPGQVVGLIGENGSGKSSILKAVAGLIPAQYKTRLVPEKTFCFFDLNLGFHPDFSGWQNLKMMNACYGLSDSHLELLQTRIAQFCEFGDYLFRPVREYSSGMKMRLGVAYLLCQSFDLLILDEVLTVGDLAFQRKCLATLQERLEEGRTILISSHNLEEIAHLCTEVLLLQGGRLLFQGSKNKAIENYLKQAEIKGKFARTGLDHKSLPAAGQDLRIEHVIIKNHLNDITGKVQTGKRLNLEIHLEVHKQRIHQPLLRIQFHRNDNLFVAGNNNYRLNSLFDLAQGKACIGVEIDPLNLLEGTYYLSVALWPDEYLSNLSGSAYDQWDRKLILDVISDRPQGAGITSLPARIYLKGP